MRREGTKLLLWLTQRWLPLQSETLTIIRRDQNLALTDLKTPELQRLVDAIKVVERFHQQNPNVTTDRFNEVKDPRAKKLIDTLFLYLTFCEDPNGKYRMTKTETALRQALAIFGAFKQLRPEDIIDTVAEGKIVIKERSPSAFYPIN